MLKFFKITGINVIMKITLAWIDLLMLSLMIVSLPSVEGPKNIFLVGYLITRITSEIIQFKKDGDAIFVGDVAFKVLGASQTILTTERTVLNILQRMSAIATQTKNIVEKVKGYPVKILLVFTNFILRESLYCLQ